MARQVSILTFKSTYLIDEMEVTKQRFQEELNSHLDLPYGRLEKEKIKEVVVQKQPANPKKSGLLTHKLILDDQLKKLKVKIKKLKRKCIGPAQQIMLETWTSNKNKLKSEIDKITLKINLENALQSKPTVQKSKETGLIQWQKATAERKKKVEQRDRDVMRSHLILREMIGAMGEIETDIKAKYAALKELKDFNQYFIKERNTIMEEQRKFLKEHNGKCKLQEVVYLPNSELQPAVDALFAEYKDYYVVFQEEMVEFEDRKYLIVDQYHDYANIVFQYEATPFLKRIFDFLEFDPRLSGLIGFIFKNYGVVMVAERDVHLTLVKDGYSFIDPFNNKIYRKEGHVNLVELKPRSQITKLSSYMAQQRKINEKIDKSIHILKQTEQKRAELRKGLEQRKQALRRFSEIVFEAEVAAECTVRKQKQESRLLFLRTEQYLK